MSMTKEEREYNRLNTALSTALKNALNAYSIGAFSGIKRFEPLELLQVLDGFSHVLTVDSFAYVTDAISTAIKSVVADYAVNMIRSKSGPTDPITRYASKEKVLSLVPACVLSIPIRRVENQPATVETVIVTDISMLQYYCSGESGMLDLVNQTDARKLVIDYLIIPCRTCTIVQLYNMVQDTAKRIHDSCTKFVALGVGMNMSSKKFSTKEVMFSIYKQYMTDEFLDMLKTKPSDKESIEAVCKAFAPIFSTCLASVAVINGIKEDVAVEILKTNSYRFAWSADQGRPATFSVIMTAGASSFYRAVKITDIMAVTKDIRNKVSTGSLSTGTGTMTKLLHDAGAMYTTTVLFQAIANTESVKLDVSPDESEKTEPANE